ncbi:Flagellar sensor histidine kinase FleS [Myxococcus hansupus]|uniref:histidine kinase n=1 Tax=Pseudomyxococcus hansupus TaxID=1297742 RepID=A0A0H4X5P9_9BACT|nr:ATP-binding protein [Myxococcus hansupus]AKQ68925.1 Flagellar sensor histidine kinase FleS [Myxococcus hansupus]
MTGGMWISLVACAGQLALAGLSLARVGKNPLALPLSVLCIALSTWNFCGFAGVRADEGGWRLVGFTAGLMTVPFTLHFILTFVGRRRGLAWAMYGTYAVFGVLALAMLVALFAPSLEAHLLTLRFGLTVTVLTVLVMGWAFALLGLHVLRSRHPDERARAGLVLLGLTLVVALLMTELAAELGLEMVRLGHVGTLLGLPVMATAALRFGLFGDDLGAPRLALHAAGIAGLGVMAYLAVVRLFVAQAGTLIVCTTAVTFALVAATRRGVTAYVSRNERLERLATLGRFSAQMAHDLKNPIAAMKGAAQYLKVEHAQGRPWDGHGEFLDLLLEQVERLDRVVDTYQRLARVEPLPRPVNLHRLVEGVLSLQAFASPGKVTILRELAPNLPPCAGDLDLLANALENLVRNACEAMPEGGTLTVRALRDGADVALEVEDTGEGMDARTRERAFDDFFTTKATGSGLGLAFVRRVVEAHGGEVLLTSREGRGTVVRMRLPAIDGSRACAEAGEAA